MGFAPWMAFPNVLTLAFEDIVGAQGAGDDTIQQALIWSIQVRLALPGAPAEIADRLFDRASPTFRDGRIGAHRSAFTTPTLAEVTAAAARPLTAFGYAADGTLHSTLAETWRRRPVRIEPARFDNTPILIEPGYLGHGLVRYRGMFYAIPETAENGELRDLSAAELAALPRAPDLHALRASLIRQPMIERQNQAFSVFDQGHKALEASLEERSVRLSGVEAALAERSTRLVGLEATMEERTRRLIGLEAGITAETGRLAALDERVGAVDSQLTTLDGQLGTLDGRLGTLDDRLATLDGQFSTLDGRIGATDDRLAMLDGQFSTLDGRIGAVDGRLAELDGLTRPLAEQPRDPSDGELRQALHDLTHARDTITDLRRRLALLEHQVTENARGPITRLLRRLGLRR
jgi:predicted  nucleic acid-binding Zn-ribbon protein